MIINYSFDARKIDLRYKKLFIQWARLSIGPIELGTAVTSDDSFDRVESATVLFRGVYPYLPMATNAPRSILGDEQKSLILNFNIQKREFCAQIQFNNLQFTVGNLVLVFLGLCRGVHPQRLPFCLQGYPLHRSVDSACILEKTGNEIMHIFIKVGGRLRGERLSYLSMYLLYSLPIIFSKIFSLARLRFILQLKMQACNELYQPDLYIFCVIVRLSLTASFQN